MKTDRGACLSDKQIDDLLHERLSSADETAAIRHLDQCATCRERSDLVSADQGLWSELAQQLGDEDPPTTPQPADVLALLGPSDFPESLGRIGSYEVRGVIGRGGAGVVLKALDPMLDRSVAIKLLSPSLVESAVARKRFENEARAIAAVTDDHVVQVHAVDEHEHVPFIVMRYVPGESLQRRLDREGSLDIRRIVRIGMQVARGLGAAHAQGIIHRDIKPGNILLEHDLDKAVVTDFGLARVLHESALTLTGTAAGTPEYMAPEQLRGESAAHRADLFALGSVVYAMCAGYPPFRSDTVYGVIRKICEQDPVPLREINADVPEWLDALVSALLRRDPSERPESASWVANVLEHELAHLQSPQAFPAPSRAWMHGAESDPHHVLGTGVTRPKRMVMSARWIVAGGLVALGAGLVLDVPGLLSSGSQNSRDGTATTPVDQVFSDTSVLTFPIGGETHFSIETKKGNLRIRTGDVAEVTLRLERAISAASEEEARRIRRLRAVSTSRHNNLLTVVLESESDDADALRRTELDVELLVPERFAVRARTDDGTISVEGPQGGADAAASGDVSIRDVRGDVVAHSSEGDVTLVEVAGDTDARAEAGLVRASFARIPDHPFVLHAERDVLVWLADPESVRLDLTAHRGEIATAFPSIEPQPEASGMTWRSLGSDEAPAVTAIADTGDIVLEPIGAMPEDMELHR